MSDRGIRHLITDIDAARSRQSSRRRFLTNGAKLAGGGALTAAFAGVGLQSVSAQHVRQDGEDNSGDRNVGDDINGSDDGGGRSRYRRTRRNNFTRGDLDVLNYALTLEHLEATFYAQGNMAFTETEVEAYVSSQGFGTAFSDEAYQRFLDVEEHEATHVATLTQVIQNLGGEAVPACEYDFSSAFGSVEAYLATAMLLENTGVMAYDGAIDLIESRQIQTAAATVATVEARHASYFNLLNGSNPFPAAFDTATDPADIIDAVLATGLIVSCPVAPPVPDQPNGCRA